MKLGRHREGSAIRLLIFLIFLLSSITFADSGAPISWGGWDGAFEKAKPDKKLVVLDLEAIWCHWCHVMDKTTYRDPALVEFFQQNVVAVKVDQDSRPDLSNRYKDYGWPATVIFDSEGRELARLSGFVKAERFLSILEKLKSDPKPLEDEQEKLAASANRELGEELLSRLRRRHIRFYDDTRGAWGQIHKFVNAPVVEYCLERSLAGDEGDRKRAIQTLDANLQLIDPVWGGVYQYSDSGVWTSPHYEKIMSTQAGNLKVYSLAYAQFKEPRYLKASQDIVRYLVDFWRSPEGGFYASQDADLIQGKKAHDYFLLNDEERRALGIPRIDRNLYARETAQAAEALALYGSISGDSEALVLAQEAAEWILSERAGANGGYRHGKEARARFLGDNLYSAKAFLALYRATADPVWLGRAMQTAAFIEQNFSKPDADGYFTSRDLRVRDKVENVALSRFAGLLYAYTGEPAHQAMARKALQYFAIESATDYFNPGGILLAADEFSKEPSHITVLGTLDQPDSENLYRAASASPTTFLRLDLWQPGTPLPPNTEVEYPDLPRAAAFACANGRCSTPMTTVQELENYWSKTK